MSYTVLVTNSEGVPGCLFDATDWNDAVRIMKLYCSFADVNVKNIGGVDWTESLESDGLVELDDGGSIQIVSSENFDEWLVIATQEKAHR